jgi:hypothetical protein
MECEEPLGRLKNRETSGCRLFQFQGIGCRERSTGYLRDKKAHECNDVTRAIKKYVKKMESIQF